MSYGRRAYASEKANGKKASDFYDVECPFCRSPAGRPCFQLSHFHRTLEKKGAAPHADRISASNKERQK